MFERTVLLILYAAHAIVALGLGQKTSGAEEGSIWDTWTRTLLQKTLGQDEKLLGKKQSFGAK